jgi:HPt (histidine-containing phosphotransfer) domain-containing protein
MDQPHGSPAQSLDELLNALWKSNYPTLLERVKIMREASEKLAAGTLDAESRQAANSAAHKLSGVLGTFGLPEGSRLASQIEWRFDEKSSADEDSGELALLIEKLEAILASKPI